jgi:hypothetical protein
MSTENTTRNGYSAYKKGYSIAFWGIVTGLIASVAIAIQLNVNGYRWWDMIIGLVLGLVALFLAFKPVVMEALFFLGIGDKLLDGKPNSWKEVITGGWQLAKDLYGPLIYVLLVVQTVFTVMSIRRFESAGSAYVAVFALAIFAAIFYLVVQKGKWLSYFMIAFWAGLALYSLGMAWFAPNYFQDDVTYEMRHTMMEAEAEADTARATALTEKVRSGEKLTMKEEIEWGDIEQRQAERSLPESLRNHVESFAVDWMITSLRPTLIKGITVPEGWYRFTAETGSVAVGQGSYELETYIRIKGKPSGERIYIGTNQNALMTYTVTGTLAGTDLAAAQSVHVTFTPAP